MKFFNKYKTPLTKEEKKQRNKERLILFGSGILMGLSFPPFPFPFTLLMFFAIIPLIQIIERKEKLLDINRAAYLWAFGFCLTTLYWVGSWQPKADPFLLISGVLLVFFNPVLFLIPSTLYYLSSKKYKNSIYLFPLFWVTYEYLYMVTEASFPWLTLGNGLAKFTIFIQLADIIGALGLSLIVVLINVLIYKIYVFYKENKRLSPSNTFVLLFLISFVLSYGAGKLINYKNSDQYVRAGLIQPNLDPWDKWGGSNLNDLFNTYKKLSQQSIDQGAKILIWPETALPVYLFSGEYNDVIDSIYTYLRQNNVYLLTGVPYIKYYLAEDHPRDAKRSRRGDYFYSSYNAVVLLSPDADSIPFYGKAKLVPFGEKMPFADAIPFLGEALQWGVGISGWNIGRDTTIFKIKNNNKTVNLAGLVCYESIYPYYIDNFVNKNADFLVVVTNDSWYGNSSGPYQHKDFAILRAVENRKSVVRAANGGISCFIDPAGRVYDHSAMFEKSALTNNIYIDKERTFFTKHPLIIPGISVIISFWIFIFSFLKFVKKKLKL